MKKLISIMIFISFSSVLAQDRCGSSELLERNIQNNPETMMFRQVLETKIKKWKQKNTANNITIPVVFHIVHKNNSENISDTQIMSQLDVLNQDFRRLNNDTINTPNDFNSVATDTEINFCLAQRNANNDTVSGITRTSTTVNSFSLFDNRIFYDSLGGKSIWNTQKFLNIYVCDLSGVLGFSSFPGSNENIDGVVIDFENFGNIGTALSPYNKGRTCTHEVGHWLNLIHIWGDMICGDDFVNDTPTQEMENYGCPSHPSPTCNNNGDMFQNYMDYTNDGCMNTFTIGQKDRMHATLNLSRAQLITSKGCAIPYEDIGVLSTLNTFCSSDQNINMPIEVILENYSTGLINSANITYRINNSPPIEYNWTGNLNTGDNINLIIGNETLNPGQHSIKIYTSNPNGFADINKFNDTITIDFEIVSGEAYQITIMTDNYGEEVSWEINSDNNIIEFGENLNSNQINEINLCLNQDSCYTFTIFDSFNDGICCDFGNGFFTINQILYSGNYTDSYSVDLCDLNTVNKIQEKISISPNPSDGKFVFLSPTKIDQIEIFNINGDLIKQKTVYSKNPEIDLTEMKSGIYITRINTQSNSYVYKIIKQ